MKSEQLTWRWRLPENLINQPNLGEATSIINQEGKILVNRFPESVSTEELGQKLAEIGSYLLTNIEPALTKAQLAGIETLLIQGNQVKYCVLPADKGKFYITMVGTI